MKTISDIDYGPLEGLIGIWKGDKGQDIAPEPDGQEENSFYETITFTDIGDVSNAEIQDLAVVHYHQIVHRKRDDKMIHNETGYWMYDPKEKVIMHSLTIPRGLSLLAGGEFNNKTDKEGNIILEVAASRDDADWGIVESPFMQNNASTVSFRHKIRLGKEKLIYSETIMVDIYGKVFEHTDDNELIRV